MCTNLKEISSPQTIDTIADDDVTGHTFFGFDVEKSDVKERSAPSEFLSSLEAIAATHQLTFHCNGLQSQIGIQSFKLTTSLCYDSHWR